MDIESAAEHSEPIRFYSAETTRQDEWVIKLVYPGVTDGFFLDVGAGRGVHASNTYALETYLKWRGICIEANAASFELLRTRRQCFPRRKRVLLCRTASLPNGSCRIPSRPARAR